jgi:hypothetical protein
MSEAGLGAIQPQESFFALSKLPARPAGHERSLAEEVVPFIE